MKTLIFFIFLLGLALGQDGMPNTEERRVTTTSMGTRPTSVVPNDGTSLECDLSAEDREENLNCPCDLVLDEGCPECPDNCSSVCPRLSCDLPCANGYAKGENDCRLCMCRERDDDDDDTVEELRERLRCHPDCIRESTDRYFCDIPCNATAVHRDNYDECEVDDDCDDDADSCEIANIGNVLVCDGLPDLDEECSDYDPRDDGTYRNDDDEFDDDDDEDERLSRGSNEGSDDRHRASYLSESVNECRAGLTCDRATERCLTADGPCTRAVSNGGITVDRCDDQGNYDIRRCFERQDDGPRYSCVCVHPDTGTVMDRTRKDVADESDFDRADCFRLVYRNCSIMRGGRMYQVYHRDRVFMTTPNGCRVCRCNDGTAENCEERGCREEMDNRDEAGCDACSSVPRQLVCGPDGLNYPSSCAAMNCGGFNADEIANQPCSALDVCALYPCRAGFSCLRTAGVSCTGRCEPNELRTCVNRTVLRCSGDTALVGADVVCGTDGVSYRSFCHMIKLGPPNIRVRHGGRCNRTDCTGSSMVCGTDRVSYANDCELRTLTANARKDHDGECEKDDQGDMTDEQLCVETRDSSRCPDTSGCANVVMPREGCCPICGGVTTVTLDKEELTKRKSVSAERLDVDGIISKFREYDVIPDKVFDRCQVHAAMTTTTSEANLEVSFKTRDRDGTDDSMFCRMQSVELADTLSPTDTAVTLPDITSYATATVAEPLIEISGAAPLTGSLIPIVLAATIGLVLHCLF